MKSNVSLLTAPSDSLSDTFMQILVDEACRQLQANAVWLSWRVVLAVHNPSVLDKLEQGACFAFSIGNGWREMCHSEIHIFAVFMHSQSWEYPRLTLKCKALNHYQMLTRYKPIWMGYSLDCSVSCRQHASVLSILYTPQRLW